MWSRSEALEFRSIGDGDSSAFRAVSELNNGAGDYDSCTLVKEECVNHFVKRLSTRILELKKSLRVRVVPKTGKTQMHSVLAGSHEHTDNNILALQYYLQQNIWKQKPTDTLSDLRNCILSSYYHGTSIDDDLRYDHGPEGSGRERASGRSTPSAFTRKHLHLNSSPILILHIDCTWLDSRRSFAKRFRRDSEQQ